MYSQVEHGSQKGKTKDGKLSKQLTLAESTVSSTAMKVTNPRWKALTESVCYFIAKDMQPLSTINDTGFLHMLKKFEPRYTPPDRKTLTLNHMPKLYVREKDQIKAQISSTCMQSQQIFGPQGT